MKVLAHILCGGVFLLLLADCRGLNFELNSDEDICVYFPNGAVLRKPGSCTETIKCKDGKSLPHSVTCTGGKIVKLDKIACGANSISLPDKYCTPTCLKTSPRYIESTRNCNDWGECTKGKLTLTGSCPSGQIFDQKQQSCIYEDDTECNRVFNICDVAKTNQKFWNKNNCQRYHYCNAKKELQTVKCPISTYYEANIGQCIKKTFPKCNILPVYEEGCGTKKLAIINKFIDDDATCRGYFYCRDKGRSADGNYIPDENPPWGKCKLGEFFDAKLEYCRDMNGIKCDKDRCDSIKNDVVLSETPGCQHYLVCQNGYTIDEVKCPDDKYFHPIRKSCINEKVSYAICA